MASFIPENTEVKFRAIFENASIGILVVDAESVIIMANQFLVNLFHYHSPDDLVGHPLDILIPESIKKRHKENTNKYFHHPGTRPMGAGRDLYGITSDAKKIPLEISLSSYKDGNEIFTIAFVSDISKRMAAQEKLEEQRLVLADVNRKIELLNEELEQKVQERTNRMQEALYKLEESKNEVSQALDKEKELGEMKSAFVSMASHEFRTPLSTILSSISLLAKYKRTDEQDKRDKHIRRIRSNVYNLNNILNEFLSLGKMNDGKIVTHFVDFNIKELIEDQCMEVSGLFKKGQKVDYMHEGKTNVRLDQTLFKNVLINLLSNATKFSPEDTTIYIRTNVTEDKVYFSVRDEGIGISEKDQKQLFALFFRGDNADNVSGTGLGLHIVKKYIELLNGELELKSKPGEGTEIKIKFTR